MNMQNGAAGDVALRTNGAPVAAGFGAICLMLISNPKRRSFAVAGGAYPRQLSTRNVRLHLDDIFRNHGPSAYDSQPTQPVFVPCGPREKRAECACAKARELLLGLRSGR